MGIAAGIGLFLLGFLVGGIIGWVLGVAITHAKLGVALDDEQPVVTLPPVVTPKAEHPPHG